MNLKRLGIQCRLLFLLENHWSISLTMAFDLKPSFSSRSQIGRLVMRDGDGEKPVL